MTVITEAELREMWQGGRGVIPPMPRHVRFTPAARDFINQWRIDITFVDDEPPPEPAGQNHPAKPAWDRPAEFPVHLEGPTPVCLVCGQPVPDKPGHMAQLDPEYFAPKWVPRFQFRGKMDTLHAHFLAAVAMARRYNLPDLVGYLTTLAAYCREITSAEYHNRDAAPLELAGLTEAEIREATHHPDRILGTGHITPGPHDHEMLLQLNLLRCQVRETELLAVNVFRGANGQPDRPSLLNALNRLSSAVYYLALLFKAGKIAWKMPGISGTKP